MVRSTEAARWLLKVFEDLAPLRHIIDDLSIEKDHLRCSQPIVELYGPKLPRVRRAGVWVSGIHGLGLRTWNVIVDKTTIPILDNVQLEYKLTLRH